MKLRPIFFWFHLSIGLTVGLVIFFLALTGFLLSFEPQIISFSEHSLKTIQVPVAETRRLSLDGLAAKVREASPDQEITGVTLYKDSSTSVLFSLGREGTLYVDPYTGQILGEGSKNLRSFFGTVTDLHRWFGFQGKNRDMAKTVKGICTLLFGLLVLSGFYLWWPRQWTITVFKVIGIPTFRFKGKQRDWNWHNAIGFWAAPWLLIIIFTGIIMIYPWANDLLYRVTGNEPPVTVAIATVSTEGKVQYLATREKNKNKTHPAGFDTYLEEVEKQSPDWKSVNIRMPQGNRPNVMAVIETPTSPNTYGRSLLTLDAKTAELIKWEPYENYNLGRQLRIWVRALHTGEAGGWLGQLIAALAVMGAMVSIFTGFALGLRRFFPQLID
jgi:uncharacterized iron-regulated membrane protein